MNGRLTDDQIARALRAHVPAHAGPELRDRVFEAAAATPQQREMPWLIAPLLDTDPLARRRNLVLAAALLLAVAFAVAVGVGAWLDAQRRDPELSLAEPTDLDAYVVGLDSTLADLPALTITIVVFEGAKPEGLVVDGAVVVEGIKVRYMYDGVGIVRHEHFPSATDELPSVTRFFTEKVVSERVEVDGQAFWVAHQGQGHHLREVAGTTGLATSCDEPWEYVGLEYLLQRPTHHVACGASQMWIDVETGLPLRSFQAQGEFTPALTFEVTALAIGPQAADLFLRPADLPTMSEEVYQCAMDPECASPASPPSTPVATPAVSPAPAFGFFAVPADLDAFVADVVATHASLPAHEAWVDDFGPGPMIRAQHLAAGAGRYRSDTDYGDGMTSTSLFVDGRWYESESRTEDGRTIWRDRGPRAAPRGLSDRSIGEVCQVDWEHRGFDLVNDRPTHHLACGVTHEFWVDHESLVVVRSTLVAEPLLDEVAVYVVTDLRFGPVAADLFELPPDAVVCDEVRDGRCVDEAGEPLDLPSLAPTAGPPD